MTYQANGNNPYEAIAMKKNINAADIKAHFPEVEISEDLIQKHAKQFDYSDAELKMGKLDFLEVGGFPTHPPSETKGVDALVANEVYFRKLAGHIHAQHKKANTTYISNHDSRHAAEIVKNTDPIPERLFGEDINFKQQLLKTNKKIEKNSQRATDIATELTKIDSQIETQLTTLAELYREIVDLKAQGKSCDAQHDALKQQREAIEELYGRADELKTEVAELKKESMDFQSMRVQLEALHGRKVLVSDMKKHTRGCEEEMAAAEKSAINTIQHATKDSKDAKRSLKVAKQEFKALKKTQKSLKDLLKKQEKLLKKKEQGLPKEVIQKEVGHTRKALEEVESTLKRLEDPLARAGKKVSAARENTKVHKATRMTIKAIEKDFDKLVKLSKKMEELREKLDKIDKEELAENKLQAENPEGSDKEQEANKALEALKKSYEKIQKQLDQKTAMLKKCERRQQDSERKLRSQCCEIGQESEPTTKQRGRLDEAGRLIAEFKVRLERVAETADALKEQIETLDNSAEEHKEKLKDKAALERDEPWNKKDFISKTRGKLDSMNKAAAKRLEGMDEEERKEFDEDVQRRMDEFPTPGKGPGQS